MSGENAETYEPTGDQTNWTDVVGPKSYIV